MNIGKWIVVAFILFAAFIGSLVTVCVRQNISLVSANYYDEELAYQDQIKRISNARNLEHQPTLTKSGRKIEVRFENPIEQGTLRLFCPSNEKMDRNYELNLTDHHHQVLDLNSLERGMYRAKLYWTANGENYFTEQTIFL